MSSQGGFLGKNNLENFAEGRQSEGSFMVKGYNEPNGGKDLFNADDDA